MLDAEPKAQSYCLIKIKRSLLGEENNFGEIAQANKISIHLKNAILAVG